MMRATIRHIATVVLLCFALGASAAAADRIVVFDFVSAGDSAPTWMGPVLADYTRNYLKLTHAYAPASAADIQRAQASAGLPYGRRISFEKMDAMRTRLGARFIVEGTYTVKNKVFQFKGSVDDLEKGSLVRDISFRSGSSDVFAVQAALGRKLTIALKLPALASGDRANLLPGTNNRNAYIAYWQGRNVYLSGNPDRAEALLQKAIQQDRNYVNALLELARIYTEKTRFLEALSLIDRAIRVSPKNDGAYYLAGLNCRLMRDSGRAAPYLMKAVELRPDVAEYQFQLGLWHEEFRQYAPALERFGQAVRIDPGLAEAWYHLAVIHARQREESNAFEDLQEAVRAGGDTIRNRAAGDADFDIFRSGKDSQGWDRKFQRLIEK